MLIRFVRIILKKGLNNRSLNCPEATRIPQSFWIKLHLLLYKFQEYDIYKETNTL